jgi:membrane protein DedA with SNARE-associated domain
VLDPVWLYGAAWGGTFLGDQCWFYVGRRYGWRFLVTRHGVIARAALDSRELSLRQEVDLRVAAPRSAKVW